MATRCYFALLLTCPNTGGMAAAHALRAAVEQAPLSLRMHHGAGDSTFYIPARRGVAAEREAATLSLPGGYAVAPQRARAHHRARSCADRQGVVHGPMYHYAFQRSKRGSGEPAWMEIARDPPPRSLVAAETHALCRSLRSAFEQVVEDLHAAWAALMPTIAAAQGAAVSCLPACRLSPTCPWTELVTSEQYIAPPHDGSRDHTFGFAVNASFTSIPMESAPQGDCHRTMVFWLSGSHCIHVPRDSGSLLVWRPHEMCHCITAPAVGASTGAPDALDANLQLQVDRDVLVRQLQLRTPASSSIPQDVRPMVAAELAMSARRLAARALPHSATDAHLAAVEHAIAAEAGV